MNTRIGLIAEIRTANDGREAAAVLAEQMMEVFNGTCGNCRIAGIHDLAVDLLPLLRPDLFYFGEVA
jgi:hypothetical protein